MASSTKLHSKLKRQKSKSSALEDKSFISLVQKRMLTKEKHVASLDTKVQRGYVKSSTGNNSYLALNCDVKPVEKRGKLSMGGSTKKNKRNYAGNKTENVSTNLVQKHRNKQYKESKRIQKFSGFKVEDNITDLKLTQRNKDNVEKTTLKPCSSKELGTTKFKLKFKNKHSNEAFGTNKLSNCEVLVPEEVSSATGLKTSHTLLFDKVQSSVSSMLQLRDAETSRTSKRASLFMDEGQLVIMVVQCIRVPKMCDQHFRFRLPHPLIDESSDVCLFVPDLKKGKNEDHEPTIEHYKELLEKNNVTGISQVMPLRQVKVEYDQYELRRRLVNQFDLFLSDGRIAGHVLHLLGKDVYKRRKLPVPVNMRAKNLKEEFDRALCKTLMIMTADGSKSALKVGHTKQSVVQISENIVAVAECLAERYPGGWDNIRSLHIHLQDSPLIPVYITLKSSNEVKVPVVRPVMPKNAKPVEGELTTFPGTHVTVMPDGEVIVKKMGLTKEDREMGLSDSDWEEFNSDEEMDAGSGDEVPAADTDVKVNEQQPGSEDEMGSEDSDDGNEQIAEAAEGAYLSEWRMQWNASCKESNKRKQSDSNNGEEEPEEKKRKIVKNKKKQKGAKEKTETIKVKKRQKNYVGKNVTETSWPHSKKSKLFKKKKTESVGGLSIPSRVSVKQLVSKGKKKEKKKMISTKLAKKSVVQTQNK